MSPVAQKGTKVSINTVSPVMFTPVPIQGAKGRGVDHAKVATVMTVVRANFVWISKSLVGLVKGNSAVSTGNALKCKTTR